MKKSLYILTEGYTEQAYFSRISEILGDKDEWKYSVTVSVREIIEGSKTDPVNMVKEARGSQKSYDEVWVVFDKDRERDRHNLDAIELAKSNNSQQNIKLIDVDHNTELTYTIPEVQIIKQKEERIADILFTINSQFEVSKLRFKP